MPKKSNKKGTYWYQFYETECVLCCRALVKEKYRVYDRPKPDDPREIYIFEQDVCQSHFI